jgi:hypothetical protein
MAKKAKPEAEKKSDESSKKLLGRIRERYKVMYEADKDNRIAAMEDMKFTFVPGKQWTDAERLRRGDRPCYQFNKIRPTVKRVINEMRKNRPGVKVLGTEDSDKETAETLEGLIRNIWNVSDADTVVDYACEYQVAAGMGAWRIETRYSSDTAFEQDIYIIPFKNPFCLYADPSCSDPLKRDAEDWIVTDKVTKKSYERRWPDTDAVSFDADDQFDDEGDWNDGETVRICEYWYKEPVTKTICLLSTGEVVDKTEGYSYAEGVTVVKEREVKSHKIMMCIASGNAILSPPTEWAGTMFPFVQIYGEWFVIDGKATWYGLTRHARDPQIAYNYDRTAMAETVAMTPKAKWWATAEQALGHTDKWAEADSKNFPFMLYNPDQKAPGAPTQMPGAQVPVALIQLSQIDSEEIKATTGIFDASLGNQSNETSGRAITARQQQGELATFNYADNAGKGVRRTGELLIDLIPKIIDTPRMVRILGVDGREDFKPLNMPDPVTGELKNDLSRGKYDVTSTTGASYATKRQEAAETFIQMAANDEALMPTAGDLVYQSMDVPYADEIAERRRATLPPQIQQMLQKGKKVPPEAQAALAQADQAMQQVQQHGQLVQAAQQELEQEKAELAKQQAAARSAVAEIDVKSAELRAEYETLSADIVKKSADLRILGAQIQLDAQQVKHEADANDVRQQANDAVEQVRQQADEFIRKVYEAVAPQPA